MIYVTMIKKSILDDIQAYRKYKMPYLKLSKMIQLALKETLARDINKEEALQIYDVIRDEKTSLIRIEIEDELLKQIKQIKKHHNIPIIVFINYALITYIQCNNEQLIV